MAQSSDAPLAPVAIGHGGTELEMFLEPTCPYSKRAFEKAPALLSAVGEDKLTIVFRFVSQPWHLFSGIVTRAILAASAAGGTPAALKAMAGVYARREDFEFEDHSHGPNMDHTPNQILADIAAITGLDLSAAFRLNSVGNALRWNTKYHRQNGVHVSPTFSIDRIIEPNMSSGQTIEEWAALIAPHIESRR